MLSAYILVKTKAGKSFEVLKAVKKIKEVKSAESVAGPLDLILKVTAEDLKKIGEVVVNKVQQVEGIRTTITCLIV